MSEEQRDAVSDDVARAILARAVELDARAPLTTIAELRSIAADIGVSPASLEVALREGTTPAPVSGSSRGVRASTIVAGIGLPIGVVAGVIVTTTPVFGLGLPLAGVMGAGLIASAGLLMLQGGRATLTSFNTRNLALWGGVAAGSLAAIAVIGEGAAVELPWALTIATALRGWVTTAVFGSAAVVTIRRAVRGHGADPDAAGDTRQGLWSAVRERTARVLHRFTTLRFVAPATREEPAAPG
jgi:hypothetical protein